MEYVARREDLDPELDPRRGRPRTHGHPGQRRTLKRKLEPMAIGVASKCKINANIGNSAVTGTCRRTNWKSSTPPSTSGADTVMDLSTGGKIDEIRQAIIAESTVPIGTVPDLPDAFRRSRSRARHRRRRMMLDMVEHQAKQGVDYMTIHAGVLLEHVAADPRIG